MILVLVVYVLLAISQEAFKLIIQVTLYGKLSHFCSTFMPE